MANFNGKTKLKDLLADPAATAILEEYLPGISTDQGAKAAYGMGIKAMCNFPQTGISKEKTDEMIARLEAL